MNFKIIKVNGRDFSEATHEEAIAAFEAASEPITVVLGRNSKYVPPPRPQNIYSHNKVDMSTQTDCPCMCASVMTGNHTDATNSLSVLMRFQSMLQEESLTEEADDQMSSHEVALHRSCSSQKLGLTLYNETDLISHDERVIVKEVQPNSIASDCADIYQGDQILKINGKCVKDMHQAQSLLQTAALDIHFTLARQRNDLHEDWSDEGVLYDDNENFLNEVLDSNEKVQNLSRKLQSFNTSNTLDSDRDFSLSRFTNTNSKDSGLGRTDDSIVNSESSTLGSLAAFKHDQQSCFSEYQKSGRCSIDSVDSAKGSMTSSLSPISPRTFTYNVTKDDKQRCHNNAPDTYTPWVCRDDKEMFCEQNFCDNSSSYNTNESAAKGANLVVNYCISSDANSDLDDHPFCYLTQDDNADSDGFQDASIEFTTKVCSTASVNKCRRKSDGVVRQIPARQKLSRSSSAPNPAGNTGFRKATFETLPEVDESAENIQKTEMTAMMERLQCSEQPKQVTKLPHVSKRGSSKSSSRRQSSDDYTSDASKLEWKVKVRSDGSRYITKRPVRERLMKEREMKVNKERCGATTDDDAMTELKLGRHWSRDDRKRHMERAKEQKRRKAFMEKCRQELLKNVSEGDIVRLSHKKMLKKKNKLDDFMSVQEILAHGNRFVSDKNSHPLLNVTYI